MAAKPSIPKGTRDFSPVEMAKRNYIFNTIRDVYHLYGFQQIETPSMEMLSTLMGKYGDEGDKLLFKIQNSGDYFSGITDEELLSRNAVKLASKFCEKGLRYDLTVPFARYVVMHRDEITFPFKRYQIQPVWRADRPQKGRYREFYQCDADVVGSDSLLNEVELMQIVDTVFSRFNIRVCIKINNRKILSGIAEIIGEADKIVDITVAIDKLDKIGLENVNAELKEKGISDEAIAKLQPIILLSGTNTEKLATLKSVLAASETGMKGVEESEFILGTLETMGLKNEIELDLTLARGLNYYTGAIFEVKALDVQIGSITGGGRYDNLTGVFGMAGVLDTARYRAFLAEALNVSPKDIQALLLGGHGDTMVPLPRYTSVGGIPVTELIDADKLQAIIERTKVGGGELVKLMGTSAWYAPGAAAAQMVEAIIRDQKRVFPVCAMLNGEYGMKDIYLGVPVVLGKNGIEKIIEVKLDDQEKELLATSAKAVKSVMTVLDDMKMF